MVISVVVSSAFADECVGKPTQLKVDGDSALVSIQTASTDRLNQHVMCELTIFHVAARPSWIESIKFAMRRHWPVRVTWEWSEDVAVVTAVQEAN